jgi:hypothetical protein
VSDNDFHQDLGALQSTVAANSLEIRELRHEVKGLTAVLNQARGAKYVIFTVPAIVGAIASALTFFGLKVTWGS